MKKLTLALMGLFVSVSAFADISVPMNNGGFEATIEGLYLKPSSDSFDYNTQLIGAGTPNYFPFYDLATQPHPFNMGYQEGFLLGVGYLFPNTGNDIQVNWMQLNTGTVNNPSVMTTSQYIYGGFFYNGTTIDSAQNKLDLNNVDVDFGQNLIVDSQLFLRFFAGLRYASLEQNFASQSHFSTVSDEEDTFIYSTATINTDFNGIGPLLGAKATYELVDGFGLEGSVDGALLVGTAHSNGSLFLHENDTEFGLNSTATQNIPSLSQTRIVPSADAKFALNYSHNFAAVNITVAAGYQVSEYFDAVNRINADSASFVVANPNVLAPFTPIPVTYRSDDLGIDGPFLSLTVKM